ncbi:MAG: hypothetical protein ABIQ40_18440 [Bacteroidia bacterium]
MKKIILFLFCISALSFITITNASAIGNKNFTSITIQYEESPNIALGQTIKIGIVALTDKGKEFKTPGFLAPSILKTAEWTLFKIEVEGGTYDNGAITISENFSDIKNHEIKITAAAVNNPEVKNELIIKLNYKGTTVANFDGESGSRGKQGASGRNGANAVTSSDQAGQAGMGGMGGQGGNGVAGQDIEVSVKLQFDEGLKKEMLYALVKSKTTGKQQLFLVDPDGGKLIVSANGGRGGEGGEGGQGGKGGDDTYRQFSTNGGPGGQGGNGGNGANGGTITVYMDPSTDKLSSGTLTFSNEGGAAGSAGQAGSGGFKGYHNNAVNGPQGTQGVSGDSGTKGPAIKTVKQKVEINAGKTTGPVSTMSSGTNTSTTPTDVVLASSPSGITDAGKLTAFDKKKPGYFEEKYDSGKIRKQGYKVNGKLEGECREYVSNTKEVYVTYYKNGLKEGKAFQYANDGTLKSEGQNKNDLMEGEWKFYVKGVLDETIIYVEGVQQE